LLRVIKEPLDRQKQQKEYGQQEFAKLVETPFKESQAHELDITRTKI
jgi:hypothetical protein